MLYDFKCNRCKKEKTIKCSMEHIGNEIVICNCGHAMHRIFSPVNFKLEKVSRGKNKKNVYNAADRIMDAKKNT